MRFTGLLDTCIGVVHALVVCLFLFLQKALVELPMNGRELTASFLNHFLTSEAMLWDSFSANFANLLSTSAKTSMMTELAPRALADGETVFRWRRHAR